MGFSEYESPCHSSVAGQLGKTEAAVENRALKSDSQSRGEEQAALELDWQSRIYERDGTQERTLTPTLIII